MQEKFLLSLIKAEKSIKLADHLTYVTLPLVKEHKLLIKVLTEIYTCMIHIVNSVLQYEYYYKRITLYRDAKSNLDVFREKCASRYGISDYQISKLFDVFRLSELHKKSPFEFVKGGKIVMMTDNMRTETLTLDKIKVYLKEAKDMLFKAAKIIKNKQEI